MTKAKQFETAWRQLCRGDFTLLEEITDPSFQAKSQGIIVDLEAQRHHQGTDRVDNNRAI